MNPESENFDAIRRVLALKRHEQPPPGYFNNFSSQVIARIKSGERAESESGFGRLFGKWGWWQNFAAMVETKPAFAGAFGAAVCALLISGLVYSENAPTPVSAGLMVSETGSSLAPESVASSDSLNGSQFISSGTNGVAPSSIWNEVEFPKAQLVNFQAPGIN